MSDSLPNFILPDLLVLQLDDNNLSGSIPSFSGLPLLNYLHLDDNALTGNIPNFNLPGLISLHLDKNNLTGVIPDFNLPNLQELLLQNNQLSGCYPTSFIAYCNIIYNFLNSPLLPWQGDFLRFCNGESQTGASCDDGNAATVNDVVQTNCACADGVNANSA